MPEHPQHLVKSHNNLGILLQNTGRLQGAEGVYRAALALQQLAADFPTRPGSGKPPYTPRARLLPTLGCGRSPP